MVQLLRGHRFERKIDLGSPDYEGYLFVQNGPNGEQSQTGQGRVLVAWAGARGGGRRLLDLGRATKIERVDMFGNAQFVDEAASVAGVTIDADPVFLRWNSPTAPGQVRVLPSLLEVAPMLYLTPQGRDSVNVTIKNPSNAPLQSALRVSVARESGVTPPAPIAVELGPNQTKTIAVPLQVGSAPETLVWPRRWTVFADVPREKVDLTKWNSIPGKLEIDQKSFAPQTAIASENRIDLAPLGGGVGERKEAILMAFVDSPRANNSSWSDRRLVFGMVRQRRARLFHARRR